VKVWFRQLSRWQSEAVRLVVQALQFNFLNWDWA